LHHALHLDLNPCLGLDLSPSLYGSLFVAKYRQSYCSLDTHLYHQLHRSSYLDLNLYLNLDLNPALYRALFAKLYTSLFQQLFATLFGSMFAALAFDFYLLTYDFFYGPMLPPRQPVGRPLPGRIVVGNDRTTTYRWIAIRMPGPSFPAESYDVVEWMGRQECGTSDRRACS